MDDTVTIPAEEHRDLQSAWEAVLDLMEIALTMPLSVPDIPKVGEIHRSDWYRRLDAEARSARYQR
jgi:hypothetical protein